jgi:hypothetical protein
MKSEKSKNLDKICQIKVGLLEVNPLIWRRFLIPANVTLHRLHLVLQDVMGWQNYHLYRLRLEKKNTPYRIPIMIFTNWISKIYTRQGSVTL